MGLILDVYDPRRASVSTPLTGPIHFTLVRFLGRPVEGPFDPTPERPPISIEHERPTGGDGMLRAYRVMDVNAIAPEGGEPIWQAVRPQGFCGPMFNGRFVWTGDSRFSALVAAAIGMSDGMPVKLFDRFESPAQYASYD